MTKQLCGIYIHYPYCDVKCAYCDFYSLAGRNSSKASLDKFEIKYLEALKRDIQHKLKYFNNNYKVTSVFFGGGTPSKANASFIHNVLNLLRQEFSFSKKVTNEITIEANPESITEEKLLLWKKGGVNRVSVGIQSTSKELLHYLGRLYSRKSYETVFEKIKQAGFKNYSADLIYGIPGQKWLQVKKDIDWVVDQGVSHISAYALTLEDNTALKVLTEKKINGKKNLSSARQVFHQQQVASHLSQKGFLQYEISNYAKSNMQSLHNRLYWKHRPYIGLGVAAHSFLMGKRISSPKSLSSYMQEGFTPQVEKQSIVEDVLLGIFRLTQWQSINSSVKSFSSQQRIIFEKELRQMYKKNLVMVKGKFFKILPSTLLFADTHILNLSLKLEGN